MNLFGAFLNKLFSLSPRYSISSKQQMLVGLLIVCAPFSLNAKQITEQDSDGDGLSDQYETQLGTEAYLADTDGDGINDGVEVGKNLKKPLDSDGDKRINALDYDDDNDGLPTILEINKGKYADADNDGLMNYLDSDSDNDGITDGIEAGILNKDDNLDGIDDAFDIEHLGGEDNNGDGIRDNLKLPDQNNNGIADYLDSKTQYGKIEKVATIDTKTEKKVKKEKSAKLEKIENKNRKLKKIVKREKNKIKKKEKKATINRYTDTDNDGLLDSQEIMLGTNPLKRDSDNDKVSDAIEIGMDINAPQDSDHDGIIDALDIDDDNDGVLTMLEDINKDGSPINDDTDDDGVPNYLDGNDDGDDKLTITEGSTKDTDKDGILDYLDMNDGKKNPVVVAEKTTIEKEIAAKQPEIVVLFDGDAETMTNETKSSDDESRSEGSSDEPKKLSKIAEESLKDAIDKGSLDNKVKKDAWKSSQLSHKTSVEKTGVVAWVKSFF